MATVEARVSGTLLAEDEPCAFEVCSEGDSPFFIVCDHAGARVPRKLRGLGLTSTDLQRHIAWDIGAGAVACRLGKLLNAFVIRQRYSRLVIDCNRPPGSTQSILRVSENTLIPGNAEVEASDARAREREIFHPYHDRITAELDLRSARGQRTVLVSMHSFTPSFFGVDRPWHAGVLYLRDRRLAGALLHELKADSRLVVGDNQPYSATDQTDYAIPVYGEGRGLLHVGIEVRQDLIDDEPGQQAWADRLAVALERAEIHARLMG